MDRLQNERGIRTTYNIVNKIASRRTNKLEDFYLVLTPQYCLQGRRNKPTKL